VDESFGPRGERLVQPRFVILVVAHDPIPPLMRQLVGDDPGAGIREHERRIFHAPERHVLGGDDVDLRVAVRAEASPIHVHRTHGGLQRDPPVLPAPDRMPDTDEDTAAVRGRALPQASRGPREVPHIGGRIGSHDAPVGRDGRGQDPRRRRVESLRGVQRHGIGANLRVEALAEVRIGVEMRPVGVCDRERRKRRSEKREALRPAESIVSMREVDRDPETDLARAVLRDRLIEGHRQRRALHLQVSCDAALHPGRPNGQRSVASCYPVRPQPQPDLVHWDAAGIVKCDLDVSPPAMP
jgi:hypothetical protein